MVYLVSTGAKTQKKMTMQRTVVEGPCDDGHLADTHLKADASDVMVTLLQHGIVLYVTALSL